MDIENAKKEYNRLLERFNKANEYFDRTDVGQEEKEKFLPQFRKVLSHMSYLLGEIEVYTKQEVFEGFK